MDGLFEIKIYREVYTKDALKTESIDLSTNLPTRTSIWSCQELSAAGHTNNPWKTSLTFIVSQEENRQIRVKYNGWKIGLTIVIGDRK